MESIDQIVNLLNETGLIQKDFEDLRFVYIPEPGPMILTEEVHTPLMVLRDEDQVRELAENFEEIKRRLPQYRFGDKKESNERKEA